MTVLKATYQMKTSFQCNPEKYLPRTSDSRWTAWISGGYHAPSSGERSREEAAVPWRGEVGERVGGGEPLFSGFPQHLRCTRLSSIWTTGT